MKRILCAMLAVLMLIAAASCRHSDSKDASSGGERTAAPEVSAAPTPEESAAVTEAPTPVPPATASPEPDPDAISSDDLFGIVNGEVYENRFLGIGCRLKDWRFSSREEIGAYYNMMDYIFSEDVSELFKSTASAVVMFATNQSSTQTISIAVENTIYMYGQPASAEDVIDWSIPFVESMLTDAGATELSITRETMVFLGSEKPCMTVSGVLSGRAIFEKMLYLERGDYVAYICFAASNSHWIDELAGCFYSIM